jgi:hypothetical protein
LTQPEIRVNRIRDNESQLYILEILATLGAQDDRDTRTIYILETLATLGAQDVRDTRTIYILEILATLGAQDVRDTRTIYIPDILATLGAQDEDKQNKTKPKYIVATNLNGRCWGSTDIYNQNPPQMVHLCAWTLFHSQ